MGLVNLHRKNTPNVGDLHAAPADYFPLNMPTDDLADWKGEADVVVIGGGGLLHPFFWRGVQRVLDQWGKIIVWGVGIHDGADEPMKMPDWLADADLVGLRDWGTPYDWVPCPSCMSPLFDEAMTPTQKVVVFKHRSIPLPRSVERFPILDNYGCTMADAVAFIASGEVVITNSYHGAYWATLLARRVLAYGDWSNKFQFMRHQPVLLDAGADPLERIDEAIAYPEALEQCRSANVEFYAKARRLLEGR